MECAKTVKVKAFWGLKYLNLERREGNLPKCEDCCFGLQGLVVGKLDYVGNGGEEGFVYVHVRVGVDRVVPYVEELNNFRFWKLVHNALSRRLVLYKLARVLITRTNIHTQIVDKLDGRFFEWDWFV